MKLGVYILLCIFVVPIISAHSVVLDVGMDSTRVTHEFDASSPIIFVLPDDATAVLVNGQEESRSTFSLNSGTVAYTTGSYHDSGRHEYVSGSLSYAVESIRMYLPEEAVLTRPLPTPSAYPAPSAIHSTGKQLVLDWGPRESFQFFITYDVPARLLWPWVLVGITLVTGFLFRKKKKPELHLLESEEKIVACLQEGNGLLWQKELQVQSGYNKARTSRAIKSLEKRGLVKKIPYGNSNKIKLLL